MEPIPLNTWIEFKERVSQVFAESDQQVDSPTYLSEPPLWRGHADAEWRLETTLERAGMGKAMLGVYLDHVLAPSIRVLSGASDIGRCESPDSDGNPILKQLYAHYEQHARLRHHGFPTPLLDWTRSPYVAAFFAFADLAAANTENVAIYLFRPALLKTDDGLQLIHNDGEQVETLGPWAAVHERHVRQQSEYTISFRVTQISGSNARIELRNPEEVFDKLLALPRNPKALSFVEKWTLPVSQREEALRDLERMNLTKYSLFGTEDALVHTVARLALNPRILAQMARSAKTGTVQQDLDEVRGDR